MAELLKNRYTKAFVADLANRVGAVYGRFDREGFVNAVLSKGWRGLELKDRMKRISETLERFLPRDYRRSLDILEQVAPDEQGFEYMFLPDFVERRGLESFERSMQALEVFTEFASAEFAVRPFIVRYPDRMMRRLKRWAKSKNEHLRRLASEGCRPRLPWAMALPQFKREPSPVLEVLEILKADPSEYVRRSVANNLNDISKDHPDTTLAIARQWIGDNPDTDWLVKHACRTLLKAGRTEAMELFGYAPPKGIRVETFELLEEVPWEGDLSFSLRLERKRGALGRIRIEFGIDFLRSNGDWNRKVFKISESDEKAKAKPVERRFSFRRISTRRYYPGEHRLAIIVNGQEIASKPFELKG